MIAAATEEAGERARNRAVFDEARREAGRLVKSDGRRDYASDGVFANFREITLGGIPAGVLYRGSHPAIGGNVRAGYAQMLAEKAGVVTVINLVDTEEQLAEYAGYIPWYQNFITRGNIVSLSMGVDFTAPEFEAQLKTGLLFMIHHRPPYLIHGNEGRDRTGFVAALLEALMNATAEEIIADYMLTYTNYNHLQPEDKRYQLITGIAEEMLIRINNDKSLTHANLQRAAETYLLTRIGLTRSEVDALKGKLSGR
ncbi:hypothetical protein FACS1894124_6390 [Spirochaetia bacterium]|nr:hypothetical protein FACS1894124_6390 [Spirochaetia bacterium]